MRIFIVCKSQKGTRRELVGLFFVNTANELIGEVAKRCRPELCLAFEPSENWELGLVGRINPNLKKAYVEGTFFSQSTLEQASNPEKWRPLHEIA